MGNLLVHVRRGLCCAKRNYTALIRICIRSRRRVSQHEDQGISERISEQLYTSRTADYW